MGLLQSKRELKSVRFGHSFLKNNTIFTYTCFNITSKDIANAIGCLRDNTSLKELTIIPGTVQSEVHLTAYH